jgi:hypothetical protein
LEEGSGMKITHRGGTTREFGRVLIYQVLEKALEMPPFSTGALLRIVGGPFTGNRTERGLREKSISLYWYFVKGTWRGVPFLETLKVMQKAVLTGTSFHRSPFREPARRLIYQEL